MINNLTILLKEERVKKLYILFTFVLALSVTAPAVAQDLGLKGIAPKVGLVLPEDPWNAGLFLGASADMGEITDNITLNPFVAYWNSGYDAFGADISLSNIQLGADVHYIFPDIEGLYAGGGLSLNIISFNYPDEYNVFGDASTSDTEIGIGLKGGYMMEISDLLGFAEAKYNIISNLNTIELAVGLYFDLTD
jgi:hypothetical protein